MASKPEDVKKTTNLVVIVLAGAFIIALAFFFVTLVQLQSAPQMVTINNIFIDVNGDGSLDYIYKADVILNTGQTNFP